MRISIVVSIYIIEAFLKKCIDSLLLQTFHDIEIILVDDGSPDYCGEICDQYAKKFSNVTVIHKENGGLSSARNAGLDAATGKYIIFIDGDDWIESDMLEKMYNSAENNNSDLVMCSYYRAFQDKIVQSVELKTQPLFRSNNVVKPHTEAIQQVFLRLLGAPPSAELDVELNMCVWRNMYRLGILKEHDIHFLSERQYISEDIMFHLSVFPFINCISTIAEPLYYYRCNDNSLTRKYNEDRFTRECYLYYAILERLPLVIGGDEAGLYEMRSFIGRARNCLQAEVRDNKKDSLTIKIAKIKKILSNKTLKGVLNSYPIKRVPFRLKIIGYLMKWGWACVLYIVFRLGYRRK